MDSNERGKNRTAFVLSEHSHQDLGHLGYLGKQKSCHGAIRGIHEQFPCQGKVRFHGVLRVSM